MPAYRRPVDLGRWCSTAVDDFAIAGWIRASVTR
jgi:hypothetical protein